MEQWLQFSRAHIHIVLPSSTRAPDKHIPQENKRIYIIVTSFEGAALLQLSQISLKKTSREKSKEKEKGRVDVVVVVWTKFVVERKYRQQRQPKCHRPGDTRRLFKELVVNYVDDRPPEASRLVRSDESFYLFRLPSSFFILLIWSFLIQPTSPNLVPVPGFVCRLQGNIILDRSKFCILFGFLSTLKRRVLHLVSHFLRITPVAELCMWVVPNWMHVIETHIRVFVFDLVFWRLWIQTMSFLCIISWKKTVPISFVPFRSGLILGSLSVCLGCSDMCDDLINVVS